MATREYNIERAQFRHRHDVAAYFEQFRGDEPPFAIGDRIGILTYDGTIGHTGVVTRVCVAYNGMYVYQFTPDGYPGILAGVREDHVRAAHS